MHSLPREDSIAQFVLPALILMHSTIYLDCEFRRVAAEIDDVSRDNLLTAEVKTMRRISPERPPEPDLRGRHFTAELLREKELLSLQRLTAYDLSAPIHKKIGT